MGNFGSICVVISNSILIRNGSSPEWLKSESASYNEPISNGYKYV